jgi:biopolymer transport protein ExbD
MGASVQDMGGSGGKKQTWSENSEINVVPFVDVMLVLLIIFMVAAPLATVNVEVDLPPSNAEPKPNPKDPVFLSIQKTGDVYLGDNRIANVNDGQDNLFAAVGQAINERVQPADREEQRIMVRADKQVIYGNVMVVMNALQEQGFYKVALVAEEIV